MMLHMTHGRSNFPPGHPRRLSPLTIPLGLAAGLILSGIIPHESHAQKLSPQPSDSSQPARGMPGATRFKLRQGQDGWWLATPEGTPFFSLGVCCVDQGIERKNYDPENPSYAAWRYYTNDRSWAVETVHRLHSWGFTTVGAWSQHQLLSQAPSARRYHTPVLHLGSTAGVPWYDMWDPKIIGRMDALARDLILPMRDDPAVIGYYADNEMGWWNAALFKMTLEHPRGSRQRQRLLQLLQRTYEEDWTKLLADFEPEYANSWASLRRRGMLYLRPGGNGVKVMRQFLGMAADRYYQLVTQLIRKYDPDALVLGDRYQSFFYPEVAQAAGRYLDAVSSNLNASWNDGSFLRCYLDTLHALTGKPIIISEFYMSAAENRSGNRNNSGVFPVVNSQADRAAGCRRTLADLLRLPYVVGADWFQYYDEPTHGREDGENFNFGLVDIENQPYSELTSVLRELNVNEFKAQKHPERLTAKSGVPPAPSEPYGHLEPAIALKHWDRERGFVPSSSPYPMADLYVCWTPRAIYLGLYSLDIVETEYYRDRRVPKVDRPVWTIQVGDSQPVRARLGTGREPLVNDPAVRVWNLSSVNLNVRNIAILELESGRLGKAEFKPGDELVFSSTLHTHARASQIDWQGKFRLSP
jgi:hypothetical protein